MKKIPERMCVACRSVKPKSELLRIVRAPSGEIKIDLTGKAAGRGAYVCDNEDCVRRCVKQKSLNKVFGGESVSPIYDNLLEEYVAKKQG